jgi:hypothetical protein
MSITMLLGMFIIASTAYRYHGRDRNAFLHCVILVALSPILYFYARAGLSEGLQFFILAIVLALQYALFQATQWRRACLLTSAAAALIALFIVAKITGLPASVGLTAGILAALWLNPNLKARDKRLAMFTAGNVGLIALFGWIALLTDGKITHWLLANFASANMEDMAPQSLGRFIYFLKQRILGVGYYWALAPIFILGLIGLCLASQQRKSYLFTLWVTTIVTLLVEAHFGGEVRRNFFSLALLMILAGFTVREFLERGVLLQSPSLVTGISILVVLAHCFGLGFVLAKSILLHDPVYIAFAALFLALMAMAFLAKGDQGKLVRQFCVSIWAVCALAPMLYQVFLAPNTIRDAARAMEEKIPVEAVVFGNVPTWNFHTLKRRIIYTNCARVGLRSMNPNAILPTDRQRFLLTYPVDREMPECYPADLESYRPLLKFTMFFIGNRQAITNAKKTSDWLLNPEVYLLRHEP